MHFIRSFDFAWVNGYLVVNPLLPWPHKLQWQNAQIKTYNTFSNCVLPLIVIQHFIAAHPVRHWNDGRFGVAVNANAKIVFIVVNANCRSDILR